MNHHNAHKRVLEPAIDNLSINGHNNKIEIGPTARIEHLIVQGHNNKIFAPPAPAGSGEHKIQNLIVIGHNNRIESLVVLGDSVVNGHNNHFLGARVGSRGINDNGYNNKFHNCSQVAGPT